MRQVCWYGLVQGTNKGDAAAAMLLQKLLLLLRLLLLKL